MLRGEDDGVPEAVQGEGVLALPEGLDRLSCGGRHAKQIVELVELHEEGGGLGALTLVREHNMPMARRRNSMDGREGTLRAMRSGPRCERGRCGW